MPFFFTAGHYWSAWLAIGALLVHIGVKLPIIRRRCTRATPGPDRARAAQPARAARHGRRGRRGIITLSTVGQTVARCRRSRVLAPRRPGTGPQHLPVNKTAGGAGVRDALFNPAYRLTVAGPDGRSASPLADLTALPQHTVVAADQLRRGVEFHRRRGPGCGCATWSPLVGVRPGRTPRRTSSRSSRGGRYRATTVPPPHVRDPYTLIALRLRRRAPAPRPRLSGPAHRPEPPRRAADQVGRPDHRRGARRENRAAHACSGSARSAMAYAVIGALTDADVKGGASASSWSGAGRRTTVSCCR